MHLLHDIRYGVKSQNKYKDLLWNLSQQFLKMET